MRIAVVFSLILAAASVTRAQEFTPLASDDSVLPASAPIEGAQHDPNAVDTGPPPTIDGNFSDLVFLNDGTTLRGRIIRQQPPLFVEMTFEDGCSTTVAWPSIQRVEQPALPNGTPVRQGTRTSYLLSPSLTPSFLWGENKTGSLTNGLPAINIFAGGLEIGADLFLAAQMPIAHRTVMHGIVVAPSLGLYGGAVRDNVIAQKSNLFLLRLGGIIGYEFLQLWQSRWDPNIEGGIGLLVGYYAGYQLTKVYGDLALTAHDFSQGGVVQILAPHYHRERGLLRRSYLQFGVYSVSNDVLMQAALGWAW